MPSLVLQTQELFDALRQAIENAHDVVCSMGLATMALPLISAGT